jgi:hypothetical protein
LALLVLMAHAQQRLGGLQSQTSLGKWFVRPYLKKKKPITKKRADGVVQGIGPNFKPQYHKKDNVASVIMS